MCMIVLPSSDKNVEQIPYTTIKIKNTLDPLKSYKIRKHYYIRTSKSKLKDDLIRSI